MPPSVRWPFFCFVWRHIKIEQKAFQRRLRTRKSCGIFTLSSKRSHYFRHFCRRWKVGENTGLDRRGEKRALVRSYTGCRASEKKKRWLILNITRVNLIYVATTENCDHKLKHIVTKSLQSINGEYSISPVRSILDIGRRCKTVQISG